MTTTIHSSHKIVTLKLPSHFLKSIPIMTPSSIPASASNSALTSPSKSSTRNGTPDISNKPRSGRSRASTTNGIAKQTTSPSKSNNNAPAAVAAILAQNGRSDSPGPHKSASSTSIAAGGSGGTGSSRNTGLMALKALDRSGAPVRKWRKAPIEMKSFTGFKYTFTAWNGGPKEPSANTTSSNVANSTPVSGTSTPTNNRAKTASSTAKPTSSLFNVTSTDYASESSAPQTPLPYNSSGPTTPSKGLESGASTPVSAPSSPSHTTPAQFTIKITTSKSKKKVSAANSFPPAKSPSIKNGGSQLAQSPMTLSTMGTPTTDEHESSK